MPNHQPDLVAMALGRLFRLGSRTYQAGDDRQYEAIRAIVLDCVEPVPEEYRPSFARDYRSIVTSGQ